LAGAGRSSSTPIGHENQVKKVGVMQRGFGSGTEKNQETWNFMLRIADKRLVKTEFHAHPSMKQSWNKIETIMKHEISCQLRTMYWDIPVKFVFNDDQAFYHVCYRSSYWQVYKPTKGPGGVFAPQERWCKHCHCMWWHLLLPSSAVENVLALHKPHQRGDACTTFRRYLNCSVAKDAQARHNFCCCVASRDKLALSPMLTYFPQVAHLKHILAVSMQQKDIHISIRPWPHCHRHW